MLIVKQFWLSHLIYVKKYTGVSKAFISFISRVASPCLFIMFFASPGVEY